MEEPLKQSITKHLVYLAENLSNNTSRILAHFLQDGLVLPDEYEAIMSKKISFDRNLDLFTTLMKKRLTFETLKGILSSTGNSHLATEIEHTLLEIKGKEVQLKLKHKWWPEEKTLPKAFNDKRKQNGSLLEEELQSLLATSDGVIVITGLGGVGKSATAKWFAHHFVDRYDHIIWIDSDKESIENSYKRLATELAMDESKQNIYRLEDIAPNIFERLSIFKCLWIFDNAEEYGGGNGISHVSKYTKFHSIVTSRNREWGNNNGHGQIPEFRLDVFSTEDSIFFMRTHLTSGISYSHPQLKRICDLIQNLPLALQIVVATLNREKIEISEYIKRIKSTNHILKKKFDDYHRTIYTTMKISLDLIKKLEDDDSDLAYSILQNFGYLRPDDVPLGIFTAIMGTKRVQINEAVDLLETYSLVTKKIGTQFLSIHRLLQKVIRVNEKSNKMDILRNILKCSSSTLTDDQIIAFKLTPYNFADETLRKEFPNLQYELIEKIQLTRLLQQNKFADAVELSKMIQDSLQLLTARYNYAVCLEKNGDIDKAIAIFESLYKDTHKDIEETSLSADWCSVDSCGLMDISKRVSRAIIGGNLFLAYSDERKIAMAEQLMVNSRQIWISHSKDSLSTIITSVDVFDTLNYCITCNENWIVLKFEKRALNRVTLNDCSIDKGIRFPNSLQSMTFDDATVKENSASLGSYHFNPSLGFLKELSICNLQSSTSTEFIISLCALDSISSISLQNCSIDVTSGGLISPKELKLQAVSFVLNGSDGHLLDGTVVVNDYVCLDQLSLLYLSNTADDGLNEVRSKLSLDFAKEASINSITLHRVGMVNLKASKWIIKELWLDDVSFVEKNQMSVKSMWIYHSIIDIASIPKSTERLHLGLRRQMGLATGLLLPPLENLQFLQLEAHSISLLCHFSNCSNLRNLELSFHTLRGVSFEGLIPESVKNLKLTTTENDVTIDNSDLTQWMTLCSDSKYYDLLIINFLGGVKINLSADMNLFITQLGLKKILIGPFLWEDGDSFKNCLLSSFVDKKAGYYEFENGFGKALERSAFSQMAQL